MPNSAAFFVTLMTPVVSYGYDTCKAYPFFICVLLGTLQAVTQLPMFTHNIVGSTVLNPAFRLSWISKLDFSTYKIINWAFQSRLCTCKAWEPINVSAPGSSCASGLAGIRGTCIALILFHFQIGIGSGRQLQFVCNQNHWPELIHSSKHDVGVLFFFLLFFWLSCTYLCGC